MWRQPSEAKNLNILASIAIFRHFIWSQGKLSSMVPSHQCLGQITRFHSRHCPSPLCKYIKRLGTKKYSSSLSFLLIHYWFSSKLKNSAGGYCVQLQGERFSLAQVPAHLFHQCWTWVFPKGAGIVVCTCVPMWGWLHLRA